ncbi:transaldolase [Chromohalobacter sp. TMW 2.2308]|uniref:Transaldolase n=1 Tax=Chromohalobacter israelensis (strain ATCC BAA-138 / DSM 3043 / CIP 106854 / NCIMB 13768 / 1H11) TaxID=290398 RepID=TAL_CHRI1|nr:MULTISPECIES: transaldolase [Chromohalobacter]Q1QZV1.1 RecName: Full=Transaldolase [Chromohalobacter salexigens DSM 3043]ABE58007.1 transaldolase [Chromohalobacter salexigens DSM 3043]MCK2041226.1 transaldolase [Chromohalobacter moromii]MCT8513374.1 transaldolase [Chromohalobacter sp. TMW 2.2271]NWO56123.1 transaldolase [Chromohalobacter salexigens]
MTQLEALKQLSMVVADTGDLEAIKRYQPHDATTNPSLILKAFELPGYQALIDETLAQVKADIADPQARVDEAVDRLSVAMGSEITQLIPGRVSTEVAAKLSFDREASIAKAHRLIELYEQRGIGRERVLIKLASTWEGIRAAEQLEKEGIQCNLTLLFSEAQARACFDAGVYLISPFVGRVTDWYKQKTGQEYTPEEDPGVVFVRKVCDIASRYRYDTVVMGASFRTKGQILGLAGCNRLTISPALLEELESEEGDIERKISDVGDASERLAPIDEAAFRWGLNQDAMATEKLAEGIRRFADDQATLEEKLAARLG